MSFSRERGQWVFIWVRKRSHIYLASAMQTKGFLMQMLQKILEMTAIQFLDIIGLLVGLLKKSVPGCGQCLY